MLDLLPPELIRQIFITSLRLESLQSILFPTSPPPSNLNLQSFLATHSNFHTLDPFPESSARVLDVSFISKSIHFALIEEVYSYPIISAWDIEKLEVLLNCLQRREECRSWVKGLRLRFTTPPYEFSSPNREAPVNKLEGYLVRLSSTISASRSSFYKFHLSLSIHNSAFFYAYFPPIISQFSSFVTSLSLSSCDCISCLENEVEIHIAHFQRCLLRCVHLEELSVRDGLAFVEYIKGQDMKPVGERDWMSKPGCKLKRLAIGSTKVKAGQTNLNFGPTIFANAGAQPNSDRLSHLRIASQSRTMFNDNGHFQILPSLMGTTSQNSISTDFESRSNSSIPYSSDLSPSHFKALRTSKAAGSSSNNVLMEPEPIKLPKISQRNDSNNRDIHLQPFIFPRTRPNPTDSQRFNTYNPSKLFDFIVASSHSSLKELQLSSATLPLSSLVAGTSKSAADDRPTFPALHTLSIYASRIYPAQLLGLSTTFPALSSLNLIHSCEASLDPISRIFCQAKTFDEKAWRVISQETKIQKVNLGNVHRWETVEGLIPSLSALEQDFRVWIYSRGRAEGKWEELREKICKESMRSTIEIDFWID